MSGYVSDARIFVSYAHADLAWVQRFQLALSTAGVNAGFRVWTDHALILGNNWLPEIVRKLDEADIILFFLTPALLASQFISRQEIRRAIALHNRGLTRVVPILIEDCNWKDSPFAKIQGFPKGMTPIASMPNPDDILQKVVEEIGALARVVKPGVTVDFGLERFTDEQLMGLMKGVRNTMRVLENTISHLPIDQQPTNKLIELDELRQRLQSYEDEFQRR